MLLNGRKADEPYATFYIGLKENKSNKDHGKKKKKGAPAAAAADDTMSGLIDGEDQDTQRDAVALDDDDIFEGV